MVKKGIMLDMVLGSGGGDSRLFGPMYLLFLNCIKVRRGFTAYVVFSFFGHFLRIKGKKCIGMKLAAPGS